MGLISTRHRKRLLKVREGTKGAVCLDLAWGVQVRFPPGFTFPATQRLDEERKHWWFVHMGRLYRTHEKDVIPADELEEIVSEGKEEMKGFAGLFDTEELKDASS